MKAEIADRRCSRCGELRACVAVPPASRMAPLYLCGACLALLTHLARKRHHMTGEVSTN